MNNKNHLTSLSPSKNRTCTTLFNFTLKAIRAERTKYQKKRCLNSVLEKINSNTYKTGNNNNICHTFMRNSTLKYEIASIQFMVNNECKK